MIKQKKRRKLGDNKRNRRLTINLTGTEFLALQQKATEAGMTMAVYVRLEALDGKVIARLEDEDRRLFRQVVGVSNVVSALLREAREAGSGDAADAFEAGRAVIEGLLNTIKL